MTNFKITFKKPNDKNIFTDEVNARYEELAIKLLERKYNHGKKLNILNVEIIKNDYQCIFNCANATEIMYKVGVFKCIGHGYDSMREIEAKICKCNDFKEL